MLAARERVSTIGCRGVDDAAAQIEVDDAVIAQLPNPSLGIPRATSLLDPIADSRLGKGDTQPNDLVAGEAGPWRVPKPFCTLLARLEMQPNLRGRWIERAPRRGGAGGAFRRRCRRGAVGTPGRVRLVDRGRAAVPAALRQHRVRER